MVPKPKYTKKVRKRQSNVYEHLSCDEEDNHKDNSTKDLDHLPTSSRGMNTDQNCKPPQPLDVTDTGMRNRWKKWIQQWSWYATASGLQRKPSNVQVASFMSSIGADVIDIYNAFELDDDESNDLELVIKKFSEYFIGKANITYERYCFNKKCQIEGQSFNEFLTEIRNLANSCEFGSLKESLIKDKIVIGVHDEKLREKLLLEEDLTLDKAILICNSYESTKFQLRKMSMDENPSTCSLANESSKVNPSTCCFRCGHKHPPRRCPAFNKICNKCGGKNHFASVCKSNKSKTDIVNVKDEMCNTGETLIVNCLSSDTKTEWFEPLFFLGQYKVLFKLDSGSQCNVIPHSIVQTLGIKLECSRVKSLVSFNKLSTPVVGEINARVCTKKNKTHYAKFLVVKGDLQPILGINSCQDMGFISRINEIDEPRTNSIDNNDLFSGIGCLKDFIYDIDLVQNPNLKIHPARKIPYNLREKVKEELDKMVSEGIIKPISEPTPCVSPMVVVKQKDKIRICIDPTDLNKNVKRRHYPLSTVEDIASRLNGSKFFTLLDCKKGFWQIRVSERTSKYLTFSTPWGRFCCLRMPFGLVSAPEVFQNVMCSLLQGIPNVEVSMDDILIHSSNIDDLNSRTKLVTDKIKEAGLKLNREKCIFNQTKIKFLGHYIEEAGISPDPEKIDCIRRLKPPTSVKELQRFLGCINYLSKFIPNVSDLTKNLRNLLEKGIEWKWEHEHQAEFDRLKEKLQTPPVLRFYDPRLPITLSVDASSHSVGCVMFQNGQPVGYSSKALTKTQRNYSQLEKETYAIVAACKKYHEYIWGCKYLVIESDHKPLESIFKKPLFQAPPRLQRMFMEIIPYNPVVTYKKGTELYIADSLSRDCENPEESDLPNQMEIQLVIPLNSSNTSRIKNYAKNDEELQLLKNAILEGWDSIKHSKDSDKVLKNYSSFRDELGYHDGLFFKGSKIIIPPEMRTEILRDLHRSHKCVEACLTLARELVFWPNMHKDIRSYVENCKVCNKFKRDKKQDEILLQDIPSRPWQFVATDLFTVRGKDFIVIADAYSGYFDFEQITTKSSTTVIKHLKKWFATHGIPEELKSDGGKCFDSLEFKQFQEVWNFNHRVSSPNFPRSNGLAERYVQEAKNLILKCQEENSDIQLALLLHRNTPRGQLGSPVQRLMSRRTKTVIPTNTHALLPVVISGVSKKLKSLHEREKIFSDRNKAKPDSFIVGERVLYRHGQKHWIPATVVQVGPQPRSLIIRTEDGTTYRRNSWFLRKLKAT